MAPAASDAPRAGTLIDQRYVLDGLLGEGSFGAVWRAHDQRLADRPVAVKVLKREFLEHESAVRRFDAEADALAKISHPNIVGVLDRGDWNGHRFIVMEFVEGRGLTGWLADHRRSSDRPSVAAAVALFDQICAGIEAAHAVRSPGPIVHRDLKPDNILLRVSPRGEITVKVADFGIAQLGRRTATRSGVAMGTPLYMAPEQAFGHTAEIGPWTDVFTLGVVLCELLTLDAQATEQDSWWVVAVRRPRELRGLLEARRADVPAALWDVLEKCLASEGPDRHPDAGALRVAIHAACGPSSGGAIRVQPSWPAPRSSASERPAPTAALSAPGAAPTVPDRPGQPASALVATPSQEAAATDGPAVPWVTLVALVCAGALALAGGIVGLLVWRDTHPSAGRTSQTGPNGGPVATRAAVPGPVANDAELMDFLRRWDSAMRLQPGALGLDRFYAPRVRWNGQTTDAAGIAAMLEHAVNAGGTDEFDWSRSAWEREAVDGADVAPTCASLPGATGGVIKVRAWADEYRSDRHPSIGCPRLTGRYLLRLRRTASGLRICHETWSLSEGICASCPTAPACAHR